MASPLRFFFLLTNLGSAVIFAALSDDNSAGITDALGKSSFMFPEGSADLCPQKINRLESFPGHGWDNLRNVKMASVIDPVYTRCQVTNDRKFLIPDGLQVHPEKRSDIQIHSELFEKVSEYTSSTSTSLRIDTSLGFKGIVKIGASYSKEHQTTKERMVKNRAVTTRAQFRYLFYTIQNNPDLKLSADLQKRLYDLASFIQSNQTEDVLYLSDLIVRDFGTHYINKVDVGAALVKEDQVKSSYVKDNSSRRDSVTWSASLSFNFIVNFKINISRSRTVTESQMNEYLNNVTNSELYSYGGPPVGDLSNFSINQWLSDVENNLVTVDRSGDPLWFAINPSTLPEIPVDTVRSMAEVVKRAVERYYKHNVYRGCTNMDAPNFSYIANLDDGTCQAPTNNYTFGGVYQTCTGIACKESFKQKNPLSGNYSCPKSYESQLIYNHIDSFNKNNCVRLCHHFGIIKYNCWDNCTTIAHTAHYQAFWCVSTKDVQANRGYMFGGVFTNHLGNLVTRDRSCPPYFIALNIGSVIRMSVCVSDDYELGIKYSLPFAGFFTCNAGNPLALSSQPLYKLMGAADQPASLKLDRFVFQEGPEKWPKSCPKGYSQHLLAITEDSCEINYCVRSGALSSSTLPDIKRPPFYSKPEILTNATRLLGTSSGLIFFRSGDATEWTKLQSMVDIQDALPAQSGKADGLPTGATAAIGIVGTLLVGGFCILGMMGCQRYRKKRKVTDVPWGQRHRSYGHIGEPTSSFNSDV